MDSGTAPTKDELKTKSMKLQRLGELFESIVIEPCSNALAIKTAEFEHPEIDKYRIIVPEHLERLCNTNNGKQSIKSLLDNDTYCHCN